MDEQSSFDSAHRTHVVFVDISSERNLALLASHTETVAGLKTKIMDEYASCFPNLEALTVSGLKVKVGGKLYHLSESMLVRDAFYGVKGNWFLYADASTFNNKNLECFSPKSVENPMGDVECPYNNEKLERKDENLEREVDFVSEINFSTVVICERKQDLSVKDVQGNDETNIESENMRANATEDTSTIEGKELPDPIIDEILNLDLMVLGENAQEKIKLSAEVCDDGVGNTTSIYDSNQDVAMESYADYENGEYLKKKKKKNRSKEIQLSAKDKVPEFEEVVLSGNVLETVGAEVGVNSLEKSDGDFPVVADTMRVAENKGNIAEGKTNDFELNSMNDDICEPIQDVPIESVKDDVKSAFKKKKKRKTIAEDASIGTKMKKGEAVQDYSLESHDVITNDMVLEKMDEKDSFLERCSNGVTEKKNESFNVNDTGDNHHNGSDVNWNLEKNIENDFSINSQSLNVVPFLEKSDNCLDVKKSKKKRKEVGQPAINAYDKDVSMNAKLIADNAEADQSKYRIDQNISVSIEGDVKRGDDLEITPIFGETDNKLVEKSSRKHKKRKNKVEERETFMQKTDENQMGASKEHDVLSNSHVKSAVDLNLLSDKAPHESNCNLENNILSNIQIEGKKKRKKKKVINDAFLDEGANESNGTYLIKETPFKELAFNECVRVSAETEMDANGTITIANTDAADDNTSQVLKMDGSEKPSRKPKKSKGSKQYDYFIQPIESANCKASVDYKLSHNAVADHPENAAEVYEEGESMQFTNHFSKNNLRSELAADKTSKQANSADQSQKEVTKSSTNGDKEDHTRKDDSFMSEDYYPKNGKITEETLIESNDDSATIEYSTFSDASEGESELVGGSPNGGKSNSSVAMMSGMSFCDVLRGSRSYKKAKSDSSRSFAEDIHSQSYHYLHDT